MTAPLIGARACKSCRFVKPHGKLLECRFGPPTANAIFVQGENNSVNVQGVVSVFPIMGTEDWCYKFERSLIEMIQKGTA